MSETSISGVYLYVVEVDHPTHVNVFALLAQDLNDAIARASQHLQCRPEQLKAYRITTPLLCVSSIDKNPRY